MKAFTDRRFADTAGVVTPDARLSSALCAMLMFGCADLCAAAPTNAGAVTFNRDIAPVLFEHCATCHRPGGSGPFSLTTYEDARPRARQILQAVTSRTMPPWKATTEAGEFDGARRLSAPQIALFEHWLRDGAPRGAPDDLPRVPVVDSGWMRGAPDLILTLGAPYHLAPDGSDRLRNFVLPVPLAATRYVRGWEFRTDSPAAVHHATLMVETGGAARRFDAADPEEGYEGLIPLSARSPDGYFLGWTPGQRAQETPPDIAWRLDPGTDLIAMLHLRSTGRPEAVTISIGLYFTDRPPSNVPVMIRLNRQDLDIPAGARRYVATDTYTLPVDVDLYAVQPHAHLLAREAQADAVFPDGTTRTLLRIPDWDFHWQDVYRFRRPVRLHAGTELRMTFVYDNSASNRANRIGLPRRVRFGQRIDDEMADLWLQVVPAVSTDRPRLVADVRRKQLPQNMEGYRKMIAADPDNPSLHDDLALLAVEAGDLDLAVEEFAASLHLRPELAASHYNVANALLAAKRWTDAVRHFHDALEIDGRYGLAHQGLGLALAGAGRVKDGVTALRRAAELLPDSPDVHYNLGVLQQAQGALSQALAAYEMAMTLDHRRVDAAYAAGILHQVRGDSRAARRAFRQALDQRPAWKPAQIELAWTLAVAADPSVRRPSEALRLARDVEKVHGDDARTADVLAAALAAAGRYDEAVRYAERALQLLSADAEESRRQAIRLRRDAYLARRPFVEPVP